MITWFESDCAHWREVTGQHIPEWKRLVGLADDGVIFVPALIAGKEGSIMMCAAFDGAEIVIYLEHLYVPVDWMIKEFPESTEVCNTIKRQVMKYA